MNDPIASGCMHALYYASARYARCTGTVAAGRCAPNRIMSMELDEAEGIEEHTQGILTLSPEIIVTVCYYAVAITALCVNTL